MSGFGWIYHFGIQNISRKGEKGMRTAYIVTIILALFLVSACGPKVNAPADVKAIKELDSGYSEAVNSKNLDWIRSSYYTNDAVVLPPNEMPLSGVDAIIASEQEGYETYSSTKLSSQVEKVHSSGDLAVVTDRKSVV